MDSLLSGEVFISLHLADPGLGGDNEVAAQSYIRQNASAAFGVASEGEKKSSADVLFENMPESAVTHIGVWDAEEGGNFLWGGRTVG